MNRRKEHGPLTPPQCRALEHAWHQAAKDGFPLNVLLSIRPGNRTPLEHAELVAKTWNQLGVWSRRHTRTNTFHAILVRETIPVANFHVLMHVSGSANHTLLWHALTRWFPEHGVPHIERATQHRSVTPSGKIRSALGYITKERTHKAAWVAGRILWQYRPGGRPVLGKRYRISANLRGSARKQTTSAGITSGEQAGNKREQAPGWGFSRKQIAPAGITGGLGNRLITGPAWGFSPIA
jgi:hypothetical protein